MKDNIYFRHDDDSHNDPKIIKLRLKYGWEGYGLFRALLEIMRTDADIVIRICDLDAFAFRLHYDRTELASFVHFLSEIGLFVYDEGEALYFSKRLQNDVEHMRSKSSKAKEAADARWKARSNANAMQTQCKRNAIKDRIGKDKEEKKGEEKKDIEEKKKKKGEEKKTTPTPTNNSQQQKIEYIQKMRAVETKGNHLVDLRNQTTGRNDLMDEKTKKGLSNFIQKIDSSDFEARAERFAETVKTIEEKDLKKFVMPFWKIREYDVGQFIKNINTFSQSVEEILLKIVANERIPNVKRLFKKPDKPKKNHVAETSKKVETEEDLQKKREAVERMRAGLGKKMKM